MDGFDNAGGIATPTAQSPTHWDLFLDMNGHWGNEAVF